MSRREVVGEVVDLVALFLVGVLHRAWVALTHK